MSSTSSRSSGGRGKSGLGRGRRIDGMAPVQRPPRAVGVSEGTAAPGGGFGGLTLVGYTAVTFALVAVALGLAVEEAAGTSASYYRGASQAALLPPKLAVLSPSAALAVTHLVSSRANLLVLSNAVLCVLLNAALAVKALFFGQLSNQELQKLCGRCVDYLLLKIVFVAAIASGTTAESFLWAAWFGAVGFLKLFGGLAKDRYERLGQNPSATVADHCRNLGLVALLMAANVLGAFHLARLTSDETATMRVLLAFDPVVIQIDLAHTLLRSSATLAERWHISRHVTVAPGATAPDPSPASFQWLAPLLYHSEFGAEVLIHGLTLAHYCHVWYLHGLSFQVVDSIILLNIRSLVGALYKRFRTFAAFQCATSNLKRAFPDATKEQLEKYGDVCAICKEPMGSAKVLPCGHIFHLPCLRSWLEQGEHGNYTCPLCRFPLTSKAMKGNGEPGYFERAHGMGVAVYDSIARRLEGGFFWLANYLFPPTGPVRQPTAPAWRPAGVGEGPVRHAYVSRTEERGERGESNAGARPRQRGGGPSYSPWVFGAGFSWPHAPMEAPPSEPGVFFSRAFSRQEALGAASAGGRGNAGSAGALDELEGWTHIVQSILPHVSTSVIVRDLRRTRNVNDTVNNLLG